MKNCVAYFRVSTKEQAKHQNTAYKNNQDVSIYAQNETLKRFLENHKDFKMVRDKPFEDIRTGTSLKKRSGLLDCKEFLKSHKNGADTLLVCFFDRLGRNFDDLFALINEFNRHSVNVYEINDAGSEPLKLTWFDEKDVNASQKVMINTINLAVKAYNSSAYIERLSRRAISKNDEKVRSGNIYFGGYSKYGYMYVPSPERSKNVLNSKKIELYKNKKNFVFDKYFVLEDEAKVIRTIYSLFINGHGAPFIADYLNSKGLKHRTRSIDALSKTKLFKEVKFSSSFVRDILLCKSYGDGSFAFRQQSNIFQRKNIANEIYNEETKYNENATFDRKMLPTAKKKEIASAYIKDDPYAKSFIANVFPTIIDKVTFDKAQELLSKSQTAYNKKPWRKTNDALLSGILFCGSCGSKMYSNGRRSSYDNPRFIPGYNCGGQKELSHSCKGQKFISARIIDNLVWTSLINVLKNGVLRDAYLKLWDMYIESKSNLTKDEIKIVRQGPITMDDINKVLGE